MSCLVQDTLKTDTTKYEVVLKLVNNQFKEITTNLKEEQGRIGKYYLFTKTFAKKVTGWVTSLCGPALQRGNRKIHGGDHERLRKVQQSRF